MTLVKRIKPDFFCSAEIGLLTTFKLPCVNLSNLCHPCASLISFSERPCRIFSVGPCFPHCLNGF